jgi:myo-inositol 2-dehydrogenase/D-chiro-inositol 1-dehydrogenase
MTVKFGLLGAGRIGKVHARAIRADATRSSSPWPTPSPPPPRRSPANTAATIRSIEAIEGASDIDAVVICTPTDTHADLIERFARAGKAVFCEKPIDLSVARVQGLPQVVEETGAHPDGRLQPPLRPRLHGRQGRHRRGRIGEVEMVTISSRDPGAPPRGLHQASGGILPRHGRSTTSPWPAGSWRGARDGGGMARA